MTDEFGERTLPPTERRRREARARGDVARSSQLVAAGVLLVSMISLRFMAPRIVTDLASLLRDGFEAEQVTEMSSNLVRDQIQMMSVRLVTSVLSVLLIGVVAALAINLLQTGLMWNPDRIMPQFARLAPSTQWSRWTSAGSWLSLVGVSGRIFVMLLAMVAFSSTRLGRLQVLATAGPSEMIVIAAQLISELGVILALVLFSLAMVDYGWQFWQREQRLKMTVEEMRRERRESEADPRWKKARAQIVTNTSSIGETSSTEAIRAV